MAQQSTTPPVDFNRFGDFFKLGNRWVTDIFPEHLSARALSDVNSNHSTVASDAYCCSVLNPNHNSGIFLEYKRR